MAISSIWSGSGSSLSSLLSTVSQYNVSKNIDYEVLAKRLQESGTTTADSTTASNTTTVAASDSTKTAESITDLYEKTQEKVQEQDDLAFLSYYSRGTSVKTEGASERASLIRSLLNGTTGNFFDAYA